MAGDESTEPLLVPSSTGRSNSQAIDISRGPSCTLADGLKGPTTESKKVRSKLIFALIVCFIFMGVEVAGGIIANSLAVLTDAAHLLSDVSGFGVALFANYYATQSSLSTHTFGYHRMEVLGALVSVLSTWLVTGILLWEAVQRIQHPEEVDGKLMFLLALVGVAVNLVNFFVLGHHGHSHGGHDHSHSQGHSHADHSEHEHNHNHGHDHGHGEEDDGENLNLKGAVLHVIGDLVQSLGVAVAGALIWWKQDDPRWRIADPICTFLFAVLVLLTTRAILRDISDILMERVPRAHDAAIIQQGLEQIEGVEEVHDLHVWALTPGIPLLAVHINLSPGANGTIVLNQSTAYCKALGIDHSTIQISIDGQACCVPRSASAPSVATGNGEHVHSHGGGCTGEDLHEGSKHVGQSHHSHDGHGH